MEIENPESNEPVPHPEALRIFTSAQAWHYGLIPLKISDVECLFCASTSDTGLQQSDELEALTGKEAAFIKVDDELHKRMLSKYYRTEKSTDTVKKVYEGDGDNFLDNLISEAKILKSSDIHIETYEEKCRVRLRMDGVLTERMQLKKKEYPTLINKIKIMANLDISEKRLPQDGRIFFRKNNDKIDIRVSALPTLHGEKIVMRLLNNDATNIDINKLGFSENDLYNYMEGVKKPHGIVLISGPTGSGKTTTLYATLKYLNKITRNIVTVEDPVEYTLEGINQVHLKENIGLTFASALRSFLRQDPDVIMLGEIRDGETASMAIRAALTGHLVLSTIHTNSAWGTISRLKDMGIPSFLLAATLNTSVAQRLVRLLCPRCKLRQPFSNDLYPKRFKPYRSIAYHYKAVGCDACHYTGYNGRKAVYEVIPVDYEISELIKNSSSNVPNELLKSYNIKTLSENAFELLELGESSLEEVYPLLLNF